MSTSDQIFSIASLVVLALLLFLSIYNFSQVSVRKRKTWIRFIIITSVLMALLLVWFIAVNFIYS